MVEVPRLHFLAAVLVFLCWSCQSGNKNSAPGRPNIVLILADDMGYDDLGVHGNHLVETPHLDALAGESVQFSQFYVTPVCASTRAALLTGRNFLRTGVSHVHGGKDFLNLDEVTMAELLGGAGYATGMWGKWHSGKTPGYYPWDRGFDEAYMARLYQHLDNQGMQDGEPRSTKGWYSEVLVDDAIDFIRRNREGPFFAYLPFMACHAPLRAPEEIIRKYRDKGLSENLATLYAMVDQMDRQIGRLLTALDEMDLEENTIVLFLSDNGPAVLNNLLDDEDRRTRYVNGFRGHKGNIWENGIKSHLFVRWKGRYTPAMVDHLADVADVFPTLMELAGVGSMQLPEVLDGRSISSYLEGDAEVIPGKEIFLYANPGWPPTDRPWTPEGVKDEYRPWKYEGGGNLEYENQIIGIRNEDFKLLMNPGETDGSIRRDEEAYVLVNIRQDPQERSSILVSEEKVFRSMKISLRKAYKDIYESEHAFEMPVYVIDSSLDSCPVLAYGPRRTSSMVKGASGYLTGFENPGDWAEYDVLVERSGEYGLELAYELQGGVSRAFSLNIGEETLQLMLPPDQKSARIPKLNLAAGLQRWTLRSEEGIGEDQVRLFKMNINKLR